MNIFCRWVHILHIQELTLFSMSSYMIRNPVEVHGRDFLCIWLFAKWGATSWFLLSIVELNCWGNFQLLICFMQTKGHWVSYLFFLVDFQVKTISLFGEIWGIGPATALKLYEKGHRTLDDLKNEESLTNAQRLGLKYFDDIRKRIPRHEASSLPPPLPHPTTRKMKWVQLHLLYSYVHIIADSYVTYMSPVWIMQVEEMGHLLKKAGDDVLPGV